MTDYQKKRITLMRKQNVGYATIAKELRLSLGAVKQFCRRNDLQSDDLETDTQLENIGSSRKVRDRDGKKPNKSEEEMIVSIPISKSFGDFNLVVKALKLSG